MFREETHGVDVGIAQPVEKKMVESPWELISLLKASLSGGKTCSGVDAELWTSGLTEPRLRQFYSSRGDQGRTRVGR